MLWNDGRLCRCDRGVLRIDGQERRLMVKYQKEVEKIDICSFVHTQVSSGEKGIMLGNHK